MRSVFLQHQKWHYATWGSPENPALLLLHGFTGSHQSWAALASVWTEQYYLIAPDLPGHGLTAPPHDLKAMSMASQAACLDELLESLSIPKAAVLGYSMGGRLALHLACLYPDRVSALILESASPGLDDPDARRARQQSDENLAEAIEKQGLDWFIAHWNQVPLFRDQSDRVREAENKIRRQQHPSGLAASLRAAGIGAQASLWSRLGDLAMPVLLVTGENDAKFAALADQMAERLTRVQRVSVAGAGHTVHAEDQEAFAVAVERFLAVVNQHNWPREGI
ncbi:2-succinyl-6-hydroxy-2,4-cyclohexadiene-1-carboxylate synthase [Sulfobacillus harzensis]|uniref:Putative 2-succinyl-6-hydroxy-2,4-cyclohexadiene-1-carboxylate synthase n=1 Tax=Sulfobacillus harzensis TaxID=2729629 RepID=A0A7Y0L504_9FIRM|nr:2-succinyl-6-hydroxy-2,4-cyclohexadiene-1-carboxylate synthase [Sulfobacillus harzensis]NMP23391.1 2-succinyl-6-hydroxy-2,4-cyclohexadiene-1-carboxylate synthase [Sulfobacillus harzensis]